jgi:hypothetical protein
MKNIVFKTSTVIRILAIGFLNTNLLLVVLIMTFILKNDDVENFSALFDMT